MQDKQKNNSKLNNHDNSNNTSTNKNINDDRRIISCIKCKDEELMKQTGKLIKRIAMNSIMFMVMVITLLAIESQTVVMDLSEKVIIIYFSVVSLIYVIGDMMEDE